jgi:hypothetical protein
MSTAVQPAMVDDTAAKLTRRVKRLSIGLILLSAFFVLSTATLSFVVWRKAKAIGEAQADLRFDQFVSDFDAHIDYIEPNVNVIQFLRHGYSITLDHVQYTQEGLSLGGTVGNATQLWVSNLALNFTARPYAYKIKDKWLKENFPWWSSEWDIGSAQTTVGLLNPGSTAYFNVTIPNVKQTSDTVRLAVSFSGERYSYLK